MQWRNEGIPMPAFSLPPSEESRASWWTLSTALHLNYLPDPGFYKPLFHQPKKLEQTQRSKSFPCVPAESASSAQSTVVQLCKRQFNHSCKFYKWWLDHSPKEGSTTSASGGRLWEWQPYLTVFWDFPFND